MKDYLKGYIALAVYLVATHAVGMSFFEIPAAERPVWLIGALASLLLVIGGEPERHHARARRLPR